MPAFLRSATLTFRRSFSGGPPRAPGAPRGPGDPPWAPVRCQPSSGRQRRPSVGRFPVALRGPRAPPAGSATLRGCRYVADLPQVGCVIDQRRSISLGPPRAGAVRTLRRSYAQRPPRALVRFGPQWATCILTPRGSTTQTFRRSCSVALRRPRSALRGPR